MINVCYMVDAEFYGGAERYVASLASGLDRARFRTSVVMSRPTHAGSGLDEWRNQLRSDGVPVRVLPMDLPWRPWRALPVWRAVLEADPHVVHVNLPGPQDGQMGLLVPLARLAGANAVVVTEHLPMIRPTWKRGLVKRLCYPWADVVTTVCRANVPYLVGRQSVPERKTVVIHNALPRSYGARAGDPRPELAARFGFPDDRVLVVFIGNLFKHKGLHRVVRALAKAPDRRWHLVVAGVGPERGPCARRLERAGLKDQAAFLGRLGAGDVERLLSVADVLVLPSTQEGLPYVILEAMASGVPVVSSPVFGIPEMVVHGSTGLLVDPSDVAALSDALAMLIDNPDERGRMGRAARRRFEERFTLDRQLRAVESLYTDMARRSRRPAKGDVR